MQIKNIKDVDITGKKILLRVDYNVPLDKETGAIANEYRIRNSFPTINYLINKKAKTIICGHLGQPHGRFQKELSLEPVAKKLSEILQRPVAFAAECIGPTAEKAVNALNGGDVLLLENLRFHIEEEKNAPDFAKKLANLADIYVNDTFSTSHRQHASIVGVTGYLPSFAGLFMEKELAIMEKALNSPIRPFAMVFGGTKVSDKINILNNIIDKVDILLMGGRIANAFLKAQGFNTGKSLTEITNFDDARTILERSGKNGVKIFLPIDAVVAENFNRDSKTKVVNISSIPPGYRIGDIGPDTVKSFTKELRKARTIVWIGPVGVTEFPQFSQGTNNIATFLSHLEAITIVGGGSTAEVVEGMNLDKRITHVSTGGGASLAFLEGKVLVGISPLLA